ncbi:MAG: hypothetical protein R3288_02270 [Woeseiaceae bacterium]|nr:hypothetical protein [Woeseiaceae bacterium]
MSQENPRRYDFVIAAFAVSMMATLAVDDVRADGIAQTSIPLDCRPAELPFPQDIVCRVRRLVEGARLFDRETFGGNGRTCVTCHSRKTGTFSPEDAMARFLADPDDPLFRHDGLDDGFSGVSRILDHATVRVTLPLPDNIWLKDDPAATHVTFNRGTPTVKNTPALEDRFMYDLRNLTLQDQALGAIEGHAQNSIAPTQNELDLIAEFQQTAPRFFSSRKLRRFAAGGPAPELPQGRTASEKRGRLFFVDAPFNPPSKDGVCALCHSGPMLNEANVFSSPVFGNPPGIREFSVGVAERNVLGNPVMTFVIEDSIGQGVEVMTPDLGMLMTDNNQLLQMGALPPDSFLAQRGLRRAFFANFFKTPTLWGIKHTAPYFHDNSAKTLEEMLEQYDFFFVNSPIGGAIELTGQDKQDIIAFLELL